MNEQLRRFQEDGYFIAKHLFDAEEMEMLRALMRTAPADAPAGGMLEQAASRRDGQGGAIKLSVHNELGDDILTRLRPLPAHRGHHGSSCWAARSITTITR